MSSGWRAAPLSELCDLKPPKSIARSLLNDDDEVSFVPMSDLGELEKRFEAREVRRFNDVVNGYVYFGDGDVLCAKITPCFENGKLGVASGLKSGVGFGSSEFVVMRSRGELLPDYLFYFLSRDDFRQAGVRVMTGAVGHKRVPKEFFEDLEVPLPPLDEQKRIVVKLDQAFAALDRARATAEANLEDAQALFETELRCVFEQASEGMEMLPFDALCKALTPKVKLKRQDYLDEGAYPVVSQEADLISGYWNDVTAVLERKSEVVVFGDHTCCLKYVDFDFVVGADGTKVLQPSRGISGKFLYYGLRSQPIRQTGYARHFKLLRETALPDLPIPEQKRVTDHLDQLRAECKTLSSAYKAKLADIAALRQSLLQAAFFGQLI
ncbi:restriction endonuclease subunit S [Luteimonas sp. TWI1416]|uniref:restriction endonuclease subunit S n=1 Tax=unclassified Luteimonas TaxID=2629088 RepID=UPI003207CBC2